LETNLILDYFPLHDDMELSEFENDWIYSVLQGQPFGKQKIQDEEGEGRLPELIED